MPGIPPIHIDPLAIRAVKPDVGRNILLSHPIHSEKAPMRIPTPIFRALAALPLALASLAPAARAQDADRVTGLADRYVARFHQRNPEYGTFLGIPGARHDRLTDNSLEAVAAWAAFQDSLLRQVQAIDGTRLRGRPEWVTLGFLREALEASAAGRVCRGELWPVSQMAGWHILYAEVAGMQPVGSDDLRRQALVRWGNLPGYVDTEIANLRVGLGQGYSTPKRNVELVIAQLDALLAMPVEESPFFSPARRDSTPTFADEWRALMETAITPAMTRYRDFLRDEYLAAAREESGVAAHPNGRECWRAAYRGYTTVERTPDEVFSLGRRTVAANQAAIVSLGERLFGTGDLDSLRARMAADPANRFAGRDEVLSFSRAAVERAHAAVPRWFGIVPRAPVVVEPIPAFREAAASSQYQPPSEGGRPGQYLIKLYQPEEQSRGEVERTAFHETYPGHHLQIAIGMERPGAHPITRIVSNSGFTEGWGRYSEALAEEMGLYQVPHSLVLRRLWPARGMVVDPGLHVLGWTREQAIDYIIEGGDRTRESAEQLVDRIVVWPAQLTAYDSGALEIFALREEARAALGDRFDIREFHDRVLEDGSLTLRMLREKIEAWIAEKQGRR